MRLRNLVLSVSLFTVLTFCACGIAAAEQFEDIFKAGLDAEDGQRLDDAIQFLTQALKIEPDAARAYGKRGELYLKKSEPENAIPDLKRAVKLDPAYADAYTRLGFALNAVNKYDEAIEALN